MREAEARAEGYETEKWMELKAEAEAPARAGSIEQWERIKHKSLILAQDERWRRA